MTNLEREFIRIGAQNFNEGGVSTWRFGN